jgi:hypothetical protein
MQMRSVWADLFVVPTLVALFVVADMWCHASGQEGCSVR